MVNLLWLHSVYFDQINNTAISSTVQRVLGKIKSIKMLDFRIFVLFSFHQFWRWSYHLEKWSIVPLLFGWLFWTFFSFLRSLQTIHNILILILSSCNSLFKLTEKKEHFYCCIFFIDYNLFSCHCYYILFYFILHSLWFQALFISHWPDRKKATKKT